ncbi:hypothetical protein [Halobaculum limi]|uniref:hypothetical protein n=1 Tax=Halobaculum limi TaxID=3031916 RepID=UPI0024065DA1|nr:hypothetical protein [Halobaculum sp. YSMS11]
MWWIALKLLGPFARGALGSLIKLVLLVVLIVAVGYAAGVDVASVLIDLVNQLIQDAIDAVISKASPF